MRAVVQRVTAAKVTVDTQVVGQITNGLLVLIGAGNNDELRDVEYIVDKVANLRIFEDEHCKMNMSVSDIGGSILAVSQFTLYGDCRKGRRPSFVEAMEPETAKELFERYIELTRKRGLPVESGIFQAHMQVELVNDGPVTLLVDSSKAF